MKRLYLFLGLFYTLWFVAIIGCRQANKSKEEPIKQEKESTIQQPTRMVNVEAPVFFEDTHDAKSYLRQTMSKTNKYEVELNNLLNRGVSGNVKDVDSMIVEATQMLVSARYDIEILENMKAYLEGLEGMVSRGNMTSQLTSLEAGWSLGPPCGGGILIITVDGDVELNGHTLEVFDHLIINGKLLNGGRELSKQEAINQGLLVEACNNTLVQINNES